jgi:carbamoyltransferase
MDKFITYNKDTGEFKINPRMRYVGSHTFGSRFTDEFIELFGAKRKRDISALEDPYPDIAFALQWRLEQIVILLAKNLYKKTGFKKFCLAGGVAMNCVLNGKLAEQSFCDDIYVQPAASDNGVSLGAALLSAKDLGDLKPKKIDHMYWGPEYSNDQIKRSLEAAKLKFTKSKDVVKQTAKYIADGKIIGWFQGRMEVGARALGNRSILASPVFPEMKNKINNEVKHREDWRPFCPSILEEYYDQYIEACADSPFMIMAFPVNKSLHDKIPSCVHIDGTARPQVVKKSSNSMYWDLINEFKKITGFGVIINTSFNIQGEPIVESPEHAIRCFSGTGVDILVIGDYIVSKPLTN